MQGKEAGPRLRRGCADNTPLGCGGMSLTGWGVVLFSSGFLVVGMQSGAWRGERGEGREVSWCMEGARGCRAVDGFTELLCLDVGCQQQDAFQCAWHRNWQCCAPCCKRRGKPGGGGAGAVHHKAVLRTRKWHGTWCQGNRRVHGGRGRCIGEGWVATPPNAGRMPRACWAAVCVCCIHVVGVMRK